MNLIKQLIVVALFVFAAFIAEAFASTDVEQNKEAPAVEKIDPVCKNKAYTHKQHTNWAKKYKRAYSIPKKARKKHRKFVRCAESKSHKKIMEKTWGKIKKSVLPKNHDLWVKIGKCEQPGRGYKGINWSHTGPTYQGGLGFWYGTWSGFKYKNMPSNAGYATWRQQMKVANRLHRLYGTSPWGCA
jgi:hypothetical protein